MPAILMDSTHMVHFESFSASKDLIRIFTVALIIFLIYFFSHQLQLIWFKFLKKFGERIGTYSVTKEYQLQRYVYQHSTGLVALFYNWINAQLVAIGLKRLGVTVMGYLLFWATISFVASVVLDFVLGLGILFFPMIYLMFFVIALVMTRVSVSERMEKREADVMNAIDLIVPEVKNGIKNAIIEYKDNFAPSVRDDFQAFISNIQDRGYTFEDAMYLLADSLGMVFQDFAQKAIYFEAVGEREMVEIFADITETNRLRRQLRDENNAAFVSLKSSFLISTGMVTAYFLFLMFTDAFSREFFMQHTAGKFLLLFMIGIVFAVLSYITTIKSKAI